MVTVSETPRVILITADELHCETLGPYGCQAIETPGIDRLAEHGVVFEHAYAPSPWCLPTRCSILLGQYPHNSGAYRYFRDRRPSPDRPNLFGAFRAGGYATAMIGKCHFAPVPYGETRPDVTLPYETFRDYYLSLGIDHLDLQDDKQVSVWFRDDYASELEEAGYLEAYRAAVWDQSLAKVFPFPGPAAWHPDAWVGRKAVEFLESHDPADPLFLWLSFSGPHYPFDPPSECLDRVDMTRVPPRTRQPGDLDDPARIHHSSYHGGGGIDGAGLAPGHG